MSKKLFTTIGLVLAMSLGFTGCGSNTADGNGADSAPAAETAKEASTDSSSSSEDTQTGGKIKIGAVIMNTSGEWFAEVMKGMNEAGKDLGCDVQIVSADNDVSKEADKMDNFIGQKVNGIALGPISGTASIPAFERALGANIPVVLWNTTVESDKAEYFVGVDNTDLGRKTGKYMVDYVENTLKKNVKIAVIGTQKYAVGIQRVDGFLGEIKNSSKIEVVASQEAEFKEEGLSVIENVLQANPDIDMVWCWNQTSMEGVLAGLKGLNNTKVTVMGTDMSVDIAKTMQKDDAQLKAVTTQQPFEIGYKSIEAAYNLATGKETEKQILVPLITYTADDKDNLTKYIDDRKDLLK